MSHTDHADEEDLGFVAIADAPSDEVGVQLAAERCFDHSTTDSKRGWVSGVLKGMQQSRAVTVREVEFTWRSWDEVMCNDFSNLFSERLDGDCHRRLVLIT